MTLFLILCLFTSSAQSKDKENIFIIASYDRNDLCGKPQFDGIMDAFKIADIPGRYNIKTFFLNSKKSNRKEVIEKLKQIKLLISKEKPLLIVTIDDLAFSSIAPDFIDKKDTYIVFSGLNKNLKEYNKELSFFDEKDFSPTKNITGVHEYLFIQYQFEFLYMILKKIPRVAVIFSTDFMGTILYNQVKEELSNTPFFDYVKFIPVETTDDLMSVIKTLKKNSFDAYIPLTMSLFDPLENKYLATNDLISIFTQNLKIMDIGVNKAFTEAGLFGGVTVDFYEMGKKAAQKGIMILNGIDIKNIKIEESKDYNIIINEKRLKELNLKLDDEIANMVDEFYR